MHLEITCLMADGALINQNFSLSFDSIMLFFSGSAWPFDFFIPATKANDLRLRTISIPDFIHYIVCPIFILQKEPVFPFLMWSANKGTTGIIFITSLVWHGPWLGIEPRTSSTRSQHSTTRLSRRRLTAYDFSHYVSALSESPGVPKLKCDDWLVGWQDVYSLLEILIPLTYLLLIIPLSIHVYGTNCLKLLSRLTTYPCFNAHTSSV